jgi:hypothetical protein
MASKSRNLQKSLEPINNQLSAGIAPFQGIAARVLLCCLLLCMPILGGAATEQGSIQVERIDTGIIDRGQNQLHVTVSNKTQAMATFVLDLRAVPGFYFRNWQQQFVYLLYPGERRSIEVPYSFDHLSADGFLRVRLSYPVVTEAGTTTLTKPFFEQRYPIDPKSAELDRLPFKTRESRHYLIFAYPDSLAEHDIDRIAAQRDHGFDQIAALLGVHLERKIPLILFPDEATKEKETGHQGAGLARNGMIIEVYSDQTKLDPYHETAHVLAGQIGDPAAMFNEGFAVYASETLGADALRELGSPGRTCDQAVRERRAKGEYIPLTELLSFDDIGSDASRPPISYPEACSVVHFLIAGYGMDKFRAAYAHVGAGDAQAFEAAYGLSIKEVERAWLAGLSGGN